MGYINFDRKNLKKWLNDPQIPDGANKANLEVIRALREITIDIAINNAVLYFLIAELKINNVRQRK